MGAEASLPQPDVLSRAEVMAGRGEAATRRCQMCDKPVPPPTAGPQALVCSQKCRYAKAEMLKRDRKRVA